MTTYRIKIDVTRIDYDSSTEGLEHISLCANVTNHDHDLESIDDALEITHTMLQQHFSADYEG